MSLSSSTGYGTSACLESVLGKENVLANFKVHDGEKKQSFGKKMGFKIVLMGYGLKSVGPYHFAPISVLSGHICVTVSSSKT